MAEVLSAFRYDHFAQLPAPYRTLTRSERADRLARAREALGDSTLLLAHNYQDAEIYALADRTGDSFKLSKDAAATDAEHIVFCGVTFMAETADILTGGERNVIIPSREAACPMAGMAELVQVRRAWDELGAHLAPDEVAPITYMNSYADLKAFTGRMDGAICTSSNASKVVGWALDRGQKVLFLPDEHLGHNTAWDLGYRDPEDLVVYNPWDRELGGVTPEALERARFILWKGMCQVHARFGVSHVEEMRRLHPDVEIIAHPECKREVVAASDLSGSTEQIIQAVRDAPAGATLAIGTEIHLVEHLQKAHPDKTILQLCGEACLDCNAMRQIDPNYLLWVLEELAAGRVHNRVRVDAKDAHWARVALDRMLELA